MRSVIEIHRQVLELLTQTRELDPTIRFTLRKSNRGNRLEQGYWFYGNEYYVALSFWSGMDWKNKTPNIVFVIPADERECQLEVNTSDSDEKRSFVSNFLVPAVELNLTGVRYQKAYARWGQDYIGALHHFIQTDKRTIDDILQKNASFWPGRGEAIGFIPEDEFIEDLDKIKTYQERLPANAAASPLDATLPFQRIAAFRIDYFGPIHSVAIDEIPFSTPWIFLTGENGTGKTSILRALATGLCQRKTMPDERRSDGNFQIDISLFNSGRDRKTFRWTGENETVAGAAITVGFAAYGASRLRTPQGRNHDMAGNSSSPNPLYASLFDYDAYLLDLQVALDAWRDDPGMAATFERRKRFILEILTDIFPHLYSIDFGVEQDGEIFTVYRERDHEGAPFRKVRFTQLASGLKSLIGMMGDILIRLYRQQPEVLDPAEFKGIVIIDEIDIHLHPKLQKELVEQLSRTFPGLQFVATTHSPVPLLGAPKGSCIIKVQRNSASGVTVQRLDDKLFLGDLLPNTILTSPIFGLDNIVPTSHDDGRVVRTEDTYQDLTFNDEVRKKIDAFLTDEKERQLIDLFKSRNT